ncbi:hypothetical protein ACONDI_02275 [Natranaerofaba carboxydovora]|nr:hypothetical protein [Natranaerofaba carboxydovora]UMZ74675.1 hypothetical protein ACONDI_02275 [Natranaerofaba carboxydovora]
MERLIRGDVVVIPFPFSDLKNSKRRPALVLTELQGEDIILCQITVLGRKAHGFQSWDESPFFYKLSCSAKKKHIQ